MTKFLHYTRRTLHKGLIHLRINKGNISLNPSLAPFIVIQPFDLQTKCQLSRRHQYKRPRRRNRSDPTTSLPFSTFPKKSCISLSPHNARHSETSDLPKGLASFYGTPQIFKSIGHYVTYTPT